MSTVAGGTFLPGCAGLVTVVEKNSRDLTIDWTNQQRESITFKAQHNLRLLSFRKIHLVLGVELLPKKPTKTNEVKVSVFKTLKGHSFFRATHVLGCR